MSKRSILVPVVALAMILGATSAFAANTLAVTPGAALGGSNYGLEVTTDGTSTQAFVAEASATDETVYRFEFRVNHNNLTMDPGTGHVIVLARQGMPSKNNIRVFLKRIGSEYKITVRAKKEGAGTANCGKTTFGGPGLRIGGEWVAASGAGMNDGLCRLFRNGVEVFENDTVSNFGLEVDNVRVGSPLGVPPGTSGAYFLDDFSSFRTLAP